MLTHRCFLHWHTGEPEFEARRARLSSTTACCACVRVWESKRAIRRQQQEKLQQQQKYRPKISAILKSLRENEGVSAAMAPWKGKLLAREEAYILNQQHDWKTAMELFMWFRDQPDHTPNVFRYNILFKIILRHRKLDLLDQMWRQMKNDCVRPSNVTYSTIIDACSKAGMTAKARFWFDDMRRDNIQPDEVTVMTMMNLYKRVGDYTQAEVISRDFLLSSSEHSVGEMKPEFVETYNTLIDLYGKSGRISDASRVFEEMLSSGLQPDIVTFNTMICICGCHGRVEEAQALFERVEEHGLVPDVGTYNTMIAVYCNAQNTQVAHEFLTKMKNNQILPDAVSYRTLLIGLCRIGLIPEVEALVAEMEQAGISLNETALGHMIVMYVKAGELIQAERHLSILKRSQNVIMAHFVGVMDAYAEQRLWEKVEAIFYTLLEAGLRRETTAYNLMLKSYRVAELYQKACDLFEIMKENGIIPNDVTYNSMIHVYCMSGLPESAYALLQKMQELGLTPDVSSFTSIVATYGNLGKVKEAEGVFQALQKEHVQIDVIAYGALLNVYAEAGMVKEAEAVISAMQNAGHAMNCIVYTLMLRVYAKHNMIDDVENTFRKIEELGPDMYARNTLLDIYSKAGMIDAAQKWFNRMYRDLNVNMVTCNIMIKLFEEIGKLPEAVGVAKIAQELGLLFDVLSYNNVIGLYVTAERNEAAVDMLKQMIKLKIWPDLVTCNRLVNLLDNPGLLKEASEQLKLSQSDTESVSYLTAIASFYSLADLSTQALEACSKLRLRGLIADVTTYNAVIYAYGRSGQFDAAVKMFMEMQSKGITPNIVTHTSMLIFYGEAGLVEGVTRLFRRMKQAECIPDEAVFKVVIDIYMEAGRLDLAAMVRQERQFSRFVKERAELLLPDDQETSNESEMSDG